MQPLGLPAHPLGLGPGFRLSKRFLFSRLRPLALGLALRVDLTLTLRRGSLERLTPVLMTALSAGLALIPLLSGADEAGREILHPVAVTIFGGLLSATALDTLLTPLLFLAFGRKPLERLTDRSRVAGLTLTEAY